MPSQVTLASFVYPFNGSRITEPPGLPNNVAEDWSRIRLAGDLATDIPPDTSVLTDQGWLLPSQLVDRNAYVLVSTLGQPISVNNTTLTLVAQRSYKVLSVDLLPEGEARVDQLSNDLELGGNPEGLSVSVETLNPIPEETCECVFLNQPCGTPHENLNDFMSFSF